MVECGMVLVKPTYEHLPSYIDALQRGGLDDVNNTLEMAQHAPEELFKYFDDPQAQCPPMKMPDGSYVKRLPSIGRWMWDGEFCGSIGLRWQNGTTELPPTCLGHIGYAVVPWKRRRGYATAALAEMLPLARELGLPFVEITTDRENIASQRVILANGGVLIEAFEKLPVHGGGPALRFRIDL